MLDKFKEKLTNMNRDIREAIRSADFEKAQKKDHRDLDLVKNLEKNLLNKTMKILEDFLNNEVK